MCKDQLINTNTTNKREEMYSFDIHQCTQRHGVDCVCVEEPLTKQAYSHNVLSLKVKV